MHAEPQKIDHLKKKNRSEKHVFLAQKIDHLKNKSAEKNMIFGKAEKSAQMKGYNPQKGYKPPL